MNFRRFFANALDGIAATFGRLLIRRSQPNPNTLPELNHYRARGLEELFSTPRGEPEVRVSNPWSFRGFRYRELQFASEIQPISDSFHRLQRGAYQANGSVHARWLRHADGAPRPTLIFLPSWMQPSSLLEDLVLLPMLARNLDVDVVRMQLPYHGNRKPKASNFHGEYFWTADLVRTVEAMRQSVHDARTLVSWIERNSPGPVGALGMSLGGMVTQALLCFEERLSFAIPIAAHLDLGGVLQDASLLQPMREELAGHGWSPSDVQAYTRSLGLDDVMPRIAPERILFIAGKYDRLLHARRTEELWQRWQRPPIHWYEGGHLGIFTHLNSSLRVSRAFLADLGLVPAVSQAPPTIPAGLPARQ